MAKWITRATALSAAASLLLAWAVPPVGAQEMEPPADQSNVPYAGTTDPQQTLDIYLPSEPGESRPAVIFIHGGGFRNGSKGSFRLEGDLARQRGWVGFSMDYRRDVLPGHPTEVNDVRTAVQWVRDHADEYMVDPNRIALYGLSAGGNLAALAAADFAPLSSPVAAVVSFSGPMNLATVHDSNASNAATVQGYLGCGPTECPDLYIDTSPATHVTAATPPMFLANSTAEQVPFAVAQELAERLEAFGVEVDLVEVSGSLHAKALSLETPGLMDRAVTFLATQFGLDANYQPGPCLSTTTRGGHPFTDVPPEAFYSDAVGWLYSNQITDGVSARLFGSEDPVTCGQFATMLHRMACLPQAFVGSPFDDVPAGAFYEEAVDWLFDTGITTGKTATTFAPDDSMTRGELAAFLHRFVGSPTSPSSHDFVDVEVGRYYSSAIDWLVNQGLTTGTTATTFSPERTITRAEVATFLYRLNTEGT